jgi:hypothetical protein
MISRRCALLGFLGTIMASPGEADATEMAASQGDAIALTATPTRIALQPAANVDLAAAFAATADRNFILTLQGLATDRPPGTGYLVFLNVPEDVTPAVDDIGYAGAVSFFGVPPSAAGAEAHAVSFEVSEVVQRLRAAGRLAGTMTVTIRPAGKPAAESHPTIRRLALFQQ